MNAPRVVPVRTAVLEADEARTRVLAARPNHVLEDSSGETVLVAQWDDGSLAFLVACADIPGSPDPPADGVLVVDTTGRILRRDEHYYPGARYLVNDPSVAWRIATDWVEEVDPFPPAVFGTWPRRRLLRALSAWFTFVGAVPGLLEELPGGELRVWTKPIHREKTSYGAAPDGSLVAEKVEFALVASSWTVCLGATATVDETLLASLLHVSAEPIDENFWVLRIPAAVPALREGLLDWISRVVDAPTILDPSAYFGFVPTGYQSPLLSASERKLRSLYFEGLSDKEIAQTLAKDEGTVANDLTDLRRRGLLPTRRSRS